MGSADDCRDPRSMAQLCLNLSMEFSFATPPAPEATARLHAELVARTATLDAQVSALLRAQSTAPIQQDVDKAFRQMMKRTLDSPDSGALRIDAPRQSESHDRFVAPWPNTAPANLMSTDLSGMNAGGHGRMALGRRRGNGSHP
ncbi:hypothetical protein SeMB42_g02946 [Synchytrium endobioticum]|uniref:Uncharacterized protein n=1 Tax=Synchytrium endobioticum TaxID=286115 RepID=A0A507DAF3_9FUNG|nr:hypothetical protein SeLEV6574_g06783 [Synchytrium endobioticum]TPX46621.1 hypothetical protein SeLEV6574_g03138 [Synchytrium endobioticum]TPX48533.1 hypothetical protein SeMB42_g02947 [Synchytrium endobioticum]TPX48534.1 hypothetical protein SeMB42_g02946 [Synchytrium endobioticum]